MVAFLCWSAWPSLSLKLQGLHLSKKVTSFVLGRGNKGSQPRRATEQLEKNFTTVNLPSKGASETQDPCTALTWIKGQSHKNQKGRVSRGNQGQPGTAYPKYSKAYINPAGDLPCAGTRSQGVTAKDGKSSSVLP